MKRTAFHEANCRIEGDLDIIDGLPTFRTQFVKVARYTSTIRAEIVAEAVTAGDVIEVNSGGNRQRS